MFEALPNAPRTRIESIVVVSVGMANAETINTTATTTSNSIKLNPALETSCSRFAQFAR